MRPKKDLIGRTFGLWVVIGEAPKRGKHIIWKCRCLSCSNIKEVYDEHLTSGRSSGCLMCRNTTHGNYGIPPYYSWRSMKRRCYDPNNKDYKYYGLKGIRVCDEWLNNYGAFRDWALNNGFEKGLCLDRIDSGADYYPSNCKWTTFSNNTKRMLKTRTYRPCQCGL